MNAGRAIVRLWIVGTLSWVAFWTWNYTANCMRMDDGSLWCPVAVGAAMGRTDRLHMALVLFGPPLISFFVVLLCFLAVRATHRFLERK
jgi:hypothetical protein